MSDHDISPEIIARFAAIVGARSPAQVDGWVDALTLQLTPADVTEIGRAIESAGAGSGPANPPR